MELPKNITQIGETNPHCKIYVEDYVISYIKQLNSYACDKKMAVALYGIRKEEAGVTYLFLYGAGKLNFLQNECRHLSQAVLQEVEKQRIKYFSEYTFLGYKLLDGEMIESFHVCEQNVCRSIEGYAQFYEKNDRMLAFMLEERQTDSPPEKVDQDKYDMVKKRQEERRALVGGKDGHASGPRLRLPGKMALPGNGNLRNMRVAAAAAFVLLGVAGLAAMGNGERLGDLQVAVRQWMENMTEKQLPDMVEVANGSAQAGTIVAEDKLTDAILRENAAADGGEDTSPEGQDQLSAPEASGSKVDEPAPDGTETSDAEENPPESDVSQALGPESDESAPDTSDSPDTEVDEPAPDAPQTPSPESDQPIPDTSESPGPEEDEPAPEPVSYTIQRGDTLIGICLKRYGSDKRVAEICSLNNISNPDDIKEGAKILLP